MDNKLTQFAQILAKIADPRSRQGISLPFTGPPALFAAHQPRSVLEKLGF